MERSCEICGIKFFSHSVKRFCTKACQSKWRNQQTGEKAFRWVGEKVSYQGVHHWIRNQYGHASLCEFCGVKTQEKYRKPPRFVWANLSGKYLRKRDDWMMACYRCHSILDSISNITSNNRRKALGLPPPKIMR